MKKCVIKRVSLLLCLAICFCSAITVFAADTDSPVTEILPEEYAVINECYCNLSISGINSTMNASLKAKTSSSLHITMELQKVKSGVYTTIETYTASGTGFNLNLNKTRLINALATYRLKVTFTAGGETAVVYAYP